MKKMISLVLALMMLMLAACGGASDETTVADTTVADTTVAEAGYKNDVAAADIVAAVAAAYGENFSANMPADAEYLEMMYGITADMYDDMAIQIPMMSAHVDTIVVVKAKEGKIDAIKAAMEASKEAQLNDGMQYPMNLPKIEASEVVVYGDYVCYVRLGFLEDDMVDEETALKQYKELNQIGKDAIEGMLKK